MSSINDVTTKVDDLTPKGEDKTVDHQTPDSTDSNTTMYEDIFKGILSEDACQVQENLKKLVDLLKDPYTHHTIQRIMEYPDLGNKIVQLSYMSTVPLLQRDAMRAIINMTSTEVEEYNEYVIDIGCLHSLIQGMKSSNQEVAAQAAWGVANIIGGPTEYVNMAIDMGLVPIIDITWRNHNSNKEIGDGLSRLLCNVIEITPSNEILEASTSLLLEFLNCNGSNNETIYNAIWSIAYIFEKNQEYGKILYGEDDRYGMVKRILEFGEKNRDDSVNLEPVVRAIGDIISVLSNSLTLTLLKTHSSALFSLFHHIIINKIKELFTKVCWCMSNTLITNEQIDIIINNGILKSIFDCQALPPDQSDEIFYIMANIIEFATPQQFTLIAREYNIFGCMMMWLDKRCKDAIGKEKLSSKAIKILIDIMYIQFDKFIKPNQSLFTSVPNWEDVTNQLIMCGDQSISSGVTLFNDLIHFKS